MIKHETAMDIAYLYRDMEVAEKLLADVKAAIDKYEDTDIRDVFGRRMNTLEMGIPTGGSGNSRRILAVPYDLAIPVIETTIASHRARLVALAAKARIELSGQPVPLGASLQGDVE